MRWFLDRWRQLVSPVSWLRKSSPRSVGRRGERIARRYLSRRGLVFVDRNVRMGRGEIDLVMLDRETLVFVEVKTRTRETFSDGFDRVDTEKRRALRRASRAYIAATPAKPDDWRIDLVLVELPESGRGRAIDVHWLPNAF